MLASSCAIAGSTVVVRTVLSNIRLLNSASYSAKSIASSIILSARSPFNWSISRRKSISNSCCLARDKAVRLPPDMRLATCSISESIASIASFSLPAAYSWTNTWWRVAASIKAVLVDIK